MAETSGVSFGKPQTQKLYVALRGATNDFNTVRATNFISENAFVIGTGNAPKLEENQRVLDWYGIDLYSGTEAIGGEDSEEDFPTYARIVRDKAKKLKEEHKSKTTAEQKEIHRFLGVKSHENLKLITEDRGLDMDPKLRDHPLVSDIWDDLRSNKDHLVREAFEAGHKWPGKRFNEVKQACGGTAHFIDRIHKAAAILRENNIDFDDTHTSHITYRFEGKKSDVLPQYLPPRDNVFLQVGQDILVKTKGEDLEILIHKSQAGRRFSEITPQLRELGNNRVNPLDPDDLDIPPGQNKTVKQLWYDKNSNYHDHHSLAALAVHDLMAVMGIPKLSQPMRKEKVHKPDAVLLPSRHLTDHGKITYMNLAGHKTVPGTGNIKNLGDFENAFENIGGAVFQPLPMINTNNAREAREQTKRKILTLMGATYYATMANLGLPLSAGRPNAVHKSLMEPGGTLRFLRDLYAAGTVSKDPERMFTFYNDDKDLQEILQKGWDSRRYREAPERSPAVKGEDFMQALGLGNNDGRYGLSFLGSSVCREQKINTPAFQMAYLASAAGMRIDHGFGTRGTMNQFIEGSVKAYMDGHRNFVNRGYRTPEIKKEGSSGPKLRDIAERTGLQIQGDLDGDFIKVGDNFSVIVEPHLGGRQHLTCSQSHGHVYNKPGSGTIYEFSGVMLHNFFVEDRGFGINEGFNNRQKQLVTLLNMDESFNFIYGLFDENERKMLNVESYNSPEAAFQRHVDNAFELGLDIPQELQNEENVKQHLQLAI